jgi:hypothetical protein
LYLPRDFAKVALFAGGSRRRFTGAVIGGMGLPDEAYDLALEPEVITMRWKPWSVTLQLRKTRTGWCIAVRVDFGR